ncbi:probable peptidyl-tRNA hydrolase [Morone saxatilis]|uniref:probable peptidyl-tRNA hydrolase n=1 Tax=Morone saxatilis TaxID=34816 RepID=UPI0015E1C14C|nr:probable peptidyl-tRNA hydrolase [Morone saxatilis]
MGRLKKVTVLSAFCRYLSLFLKKLLNFVTMRRLLTRVINRVLLGELFTPAMGIEEQIHTEGRRRLVVGLGNPGMEGTRHSVGMAVLGALATRLSVDDRWRRQKHISGLLMDETDSTFNVSSKVSVCSPLARKYSIKPEDILLVHDELDKPLGKITIKHGGSARGHNGVRSCVDCLQTDVMPRLLVGIGRPTGKTPVDRHVLGKFSSDEKKVLDSVLVQSVDLLLKQLSEQDSQQDPQSPSSPAGGRRAAQKRKEPSASPAEDSAAAQS